MNIFIETIKLALNNMIKQYEKEKQDEDELMYEILKRSKVVIENLSINGIEILGHNDDQFYEQCKEKRNILFLTDEELKIYNEAQKNNDKLKQILDIINE